MKISTLLQAAPADTLNAVQAEIVAVAEKLTTTPPSELLKDLIDSAVAFGLKVIAAFVIYFIGAWLIKKIKKILTRIFEKRQTDEAIASFIQSIVSIAMTIMLIIITIGALGIDTTSIAALLAGGGMAIGMALNGTVQNFAGGIMIIIFKPFKADDFVEVGGYSGTVEEVSITSTKLRTTDNRIIIIPNGVIANGTINNYSHLPLRRLDLTVDVEYGTQADKVCETLNEIIKADGRILTAATEGAADPFVSINALRDSSVQFVIKVWVKTEDYWDVNYDFIAQIYDQLPKKGIKFPYPKLDVNILNK
ncbi:MAG: mechanosensitive ion channel [Bacteroidales bacterium]|nr:mechanosensitive ion channel [Bacteroidales bacterium]